MALDARFWPPILIHHGIIPGYYKTQFLDREFGRWCRGHYRETSAEKEIRLLEYQLRKKTKAHQRHQQKIAECREKLLKCRDKFKKLQNLKHGDFNQKVEKLKHCKYDFNQSMDQDSNPKLQQLKEIMNDAIDKINDYAKQSEAAFNESIFYLDMCEKVLEDAMDKVNHSMEEGEESSAGSAFEGFEGMVKFEMLEDSADGGSENFDDMLEPTSLAIEDGSDGSA